MREFAKISPQFWINETGRKIKQTNVEVRLIALYLLTNPHANMVGVYYLPVALIAHEVGISQENIAKGLATLRDINFCSYDITNEYVWVHDMALEQTGANLKMTDNRVKSVKNTYYLLPELSFTNEFYNKYADIYFLDIEDDQVDACETPSKPLPSKEKKKENDKNNENVEEENKRMSGKPDVHALLENNLPTVDLKNVSVDPSLLSLREQAVQLLQFLNERAGRCYRPVEANLKLIIGRLKSGATYMDCRQVIVKKTRQWKGNIKMDDYLRPSTLFHHEKFEQYLGELVLPKQGEAI